MPNRRRQDEGVIETSNIVAEPANGSPPRFRAHHEKLDAFVEECNRELCVSRGLHACEASVSASWRGQAVLRREEMTNERDPTTLAPVTMTIETPLDLPWLMPKDKLETASEILTRALHDIEQVMRDQCAKNKGIMRQSFNGFAQQSGRITVPSGVDIGR